MKSQFVSIFSRLFYLTTVGLFIFCAIFLSITPLKAQDPAPPNRGVQLSGSYAIDDIATIDTQSGNLGIRLPLAALPQGRGASTSGGIGLTYNSKIWDIHVDYDAASNGTPYQNLWGSEKGGWKYSFDYKIEVQDKVDNYASAGSLNCQTTPGVVDRWRLQMTFPDGGTHLFRPVGYAPDTDGYTNISPQGNLSVCVNSYPTPYLSITQLTNHVVYYSVDGSGLRLETDRVGYDFSWTLYFPNGSKVVQNVNTPQRMYDRNNHYFDIQNIANYNGTGLPATQITDQLNRSIAVVYDYYAGQDYVYQVGVGGSQSLQTTIVWSWAQLNKTFYLVDPSYPPVNPWLPTSGDLGWRYDVSQVILPTQSGGQSYTFGYNGISNSGWGELSTIILPSGANAAYQYFLDGANYQLASDVIQNQRVTHKALTHTSEYDGVTAAPVTDNWTYSGAMITNPNGATSIEYFENRRSAKSVSADGTVVERIWNYNSIPYSILPINCTAPCLQDNPYVKTEFTSLKDTSGNLSKTAIKDYQVDKNGNTTRIIQYDWVSYGTVARDGNGKPTGIIPGGATIKRVTVNEYTAPTPDASDLSLSSNAYYASNPPRLRDTVANTEVRSGTSSGSVVSRTELTYDNAANTGNVITQKTWDSDKGTISYPLTSGNSISTSNEYETFVDGTTGKQVRTIDANGNVSRLYYEDISNGTSSLYITKTIVGDNVAGNSSIKRTNEYKYDFATGLVTEAKDSDNNIINRTTYDLLGRPTLLEEGGSGAPLTFLRQTTTEYSNSLRRVIVRSDKDTKGDGKLISVQHSDQLGRNRLSRKIESGVAADAYDETKGIKVQTRYFSGNTTNPEGYVVTSNPYRADYSNNAASEPTMGWTRSKSDQAGRTIEVQAYSGTALPAPFGANATNKGKVLTYYDGEKVRTTDQAGKQRTTATDALGRLLNVWEAPNVENYLTTYTYDVLDSLTNVNQGGQVRSFVYSSLKRLTSVNHPESGITNYTYDNNGNLYQKTDARSTPVTTTFTYDRLNRVQAKNYSSHPGGTANVDYIYDGAPNGKGKFSYNVSYNTESNGTLIYNYDQINNYDKLGRVTSKSQNYLVYQGGWAWKPYTTTATYNLTGGMTSETYPSGRTVNYAYDDAGRNTSFTGNLGDTVLRNYSTQMTYLPGGQLTKETFGTTTALYQRLNYNTQQQLFAVRVGTDDAVASDGNPSTDYHPQPASWDRGMLLWHYGNEDMTAGWGRGGSDNNGNVLRAHHYIPCAGGGQCALYVDDFEFDNLNRLKKDTGWYNSNYVQAFDYDRWGNRTINQALTTTSVDINKKSYTANSTTNRLEKPVGQSGTMMYDNVGNLTADTYTNPSSIGALGAMEYDAENHLTAAMSGAHKYRYNADGKRVRRIIAGQGEFWMVYGISGELVAEYNASSSIPLATAPSKEFGYRNGKLLIIAEGSNPKWLIQDHLGSTRMEIGLSGASNAVTRHDYLPFGEELAGSMRSGNGYGGGSNTKQKFTGYERDTETNLDFAQARYMSSIQGRFTSADPSLLNVDSTNPQSWNGYAYVMNNPLSNVDPTGLWTVVSRIIYEKNPDGTDNINKIVRVEVFLVQEAGDDATTLAKALNISQKDADKIYGKRVTESDGHTLIRGKETGNLVYDSIEDYLKSWNQDIIKHGMSAATNKRRGLDCSVTAASICFGRFAGVGGTEGVDDALSIGRNGERNVENIQDNRIRVGDLVRFALSAKDDATHFSTFLLFNKEGVPLVFSKSGIDGPFEFRSTTQLSEQYSIYGTVQPLKNTKDKTGYYRSTIR